MMIISLRCVPFWFIKTPLMTKKVVVFTDQDNNDYYWFRIDRKQQPCRVTREWKPTAFLRERKNESNSETEKLIKSANFMRFVT